MGAFETGTTQNSAPGLMRHAGAACTPAAVGSDPVSPHFFFHQSFLPWRGGCEGSVTIAFATVVQEKGAIFFACLVLLYPG